MNALADIANKDDSIKAVLDTGAVSSVTGKDIMNATISKMEPRARKLIKVSKSTKTFKFGGGERRKSLGHYAIPISIGNGHNIILYTDVIDAPIPCLISKAAIKAAESVIDTRDDTITCLIERRSNCARFLRDITESQSSLSNFGIKIPHSVQSSKSPKKTSRTRTGRSS